jgi:hypothetical protein
MGQEVSIVKFFPKDAAKSADAVLEQALGEFSEVLILGWDKDGDFDARATLGLKDGAEILWLVEVFKAKLMNGDFSE